MLYVTSACAEHEKCSLADVNTTYRERKATQYSGRLNDSVKFSVSKNYFYEKYLLLRFYFISSLLFKSDHQMISNIKINNIYLCNNL